MSACAQDRCRIETDVPQVELEAFLPELMLSAPGLPQEIAASYIRQAAIDMAESGNTLRRTVRIELQAGVQNYLLEPPDCVRTIGVSRISGRNGWCNSGYRMVPDDVPMPAIGCLQVPVAGCAAFGFGPSANQAWGVGGIAKLQNPNELWVSPVPQCDADLGIEVELIVAPKRDACTVDRVMFDRYAPALVAGALMYLYRLPKQDWTDYNLAQKMETEFKKWTTKASGDRLLGAARGPFRLVTPRIV